MWCCECHFLCELNFCSTSFVQYVQMIPMEEKIALGDLNVDMLESTC